MNSFLQSPVIRNTKLKNVENLQEQYLVPTSDSQLCLRGKRSQRLWSNVSSLQVNNDKVQDTSKGRIVHVALKETLLDFIHDNEKDNLGNLSDNQPVKHTTSTEENMQKQRTHEELIKLENWCDKALNEVLVDFACCKGEKKLNACSDDSVIAENILNQILSEFNDDDGVAYVPFPSERRKIMGETESNLNEALADLTSPAKTKKNNSCFHQKGVTENYSSNSFSNDTYYDEDEDDDIAYVPFPSERRSFMRKTEDMINTVLQDFTSHTDMKKPNNYCHQGMTETYCFTCYSKDTYYDNNTDDDDNDDDDDTAYVPFPSERRKLTGEHVNIHDICK